MPRSRPLIRNSLGPGGEERPVERRHWRDPSMCPYRGMSCALGGIYPMGLINGLEQSCRPNEAGNTIALGPSTLLSQLNIEVTGHMSLLGSGTGG